MSAVIDDATRSGEAFIDAVERVADHSVHIVQDELTLARIEMVEKLPILAGGLTKAIIGLAATLTGLLLGSFALAFLLADYVFGDHLWPGFALLAVALLGAAFLLTRRAWSESKEALPPVPTEAIDQARKLRDDVRR